MMKRFFVGLIYLAALAIPAGAITLWSSSTGDVNIPGLSAIAIDNMLIGQTTPAAGSFTALSATSEQLDTGTKTATATGTTTATATLNKSAGVITSAGLTTAAGGTWVLTLTDSKIAATDQVFASVGNGTNTGGSPAVTTVTPGAGQVVITVQNLHASAAFNNTIQVSFSDLKN